MMIVRKTGGDTYFSASNSAEGFCCHYAERFGDSAISRVYAVKGGPGTGKSRFLREVGQYGEKNGYTAEWIVCSSDPDSFDAVILSGKKGKIALVDATPPHVLEPMSPGVREEIINLGDFWNADLLAEQRNEIDALNAEKHNAYAAAYRYLSAYGDATRIRDALISPFVRRENLRRYVERLTREIRPEKAFSAVTALMRSVGMRGEVALDSYAAEAKNIFLIEDCRGAAQYLMADLLDLAKKKRLSVRVSHDPIEPHKTDALYLCNSGTAFLVGTPSVCPYPHKTIRIRRFVDTAAMHPIRERLTFAEQIRRATREGAIRELEEVGKAHFRLESIYSAAMDFSAKEEFTKKFCQKLFGLQNT